MLEEKLFTINADYIDFSNFQVLGAFFFHPVVDETGRNFSMKRGTRGGEEGRRRM